MKTVAKRLAMGLVAIAAMTAPGARAQSLEQNLSQLSSRSAKLYVTPLASAFAANMNTGWYHRAPMASRMAFHFEGGVTGMGAFLGGGPRGFKTRENFNLSRDEARQLVTPYVDGNSAFASWTPEERARLKDSLTTRLTLQESNVTVFGPTITGSRRDSVKMIFEGETVVVGSADPFPGAATSFTIPAGDTVAPGAERGTPVLGMLRSLTALPQFVPQITVGTLYGTNLTLRWLPETQTIEEVGALGFFGFGIQHNPKAWLARPLPVDLTFGYHMQWLSAADIMEASSWAASVNVSRTYSRRFFNVSPYAGLQIERAKLDFSYDQSVQLNDLDGSYRNVPVAFTVEGDNLVRGTVGVNVRFLAISLHADYGLSKYSAFSGGLLIGI